MTTIDTVSALFVGETTAGFRLYDVGPINDEQPQHLDSQANNPEVLSKAEAQGTFSELDQQQTKIGLWGIIKQHVSKNAKVLVLLAALALCGAVLSILQHSTFGNLLYLLTIYCACQSLGKIEQTHLNR